MTRIVVINPNTSAVLTARIGEAAAAVLPGADVVAVRPSRGVPSVESHVDEAWATLGILERIESEPADAYVIACFGDTGIDAAREAAGGIPVVGMTEAALFAAATVAHRFAIVTMPVRTIAQSLRVVERLGLGHRCTVAALDTAVAELEDGDIAQLDAFEAESRRLIAAGAEAIVLGCAGLTALVAPLRERLGVPVIEGVAAGVGLAASLVAQGLTTSPRGGWAPVPGAPSAAALSDGEALR